MRPYLEIKPLEQLQIFHLGHIPNAKLIIHADGAMEVWGWKKEEETHVDMHEV